MDLEGNIYDLRGNFIGTTDGDGGQQQMDGSQLLVEEDGQYLEDGDDY